MIVAGIEISLSSSPAPQKSEKYCRDENNDFQYDGPIFQV